MTTDKAKEALNGIKSYENTMDLIENHSVSVQDACTIGINAIETVERLKYLCKTYKQKGHAPTRTISMEALKDFIGEVEE